MRFSVSRQFEPVPELTVEARYTFHFGNDGEFKQVDLSKRKVYGRSGPGTNSNQFDAVEDLSLSKVPTNVIEEAGLRLLQSKSNLIEQAREEGAKDSKQ